jgi:nucleotide-binding universal stress UspA family protein
MLRPTTDAVEPRRADDRAVKRILIATDGSPASREAIAFGLELAQEHAAEVTFVHVVPVLDRAVAAGIGIPAAAPHRIDEVDRRPLEDALALVAERDVDAKAELLAGEPVDEIVAYADSLDADLIVLGSRGGGAMATALLGSVSRGVLHEAHRPVLVVRSPQVREPAAL